MWASICIAVSKFVVTVVCLLLAGALLLGFMLRPLISFKLPYTGLKAMQDHVVLGEPAHEGYFNLGTRTFTSLQVLCLRCLGDPGNPRKAAAPSHQRTKVRLSGYPKRRKFPPPAQLTGRVKGSQKVGASPETYRREKATMDHPVSFRPH